MSQENPLNKPTSENEIVAGEGFEMRGLSSEEERRSKELERRALSAAETERTKDFTEADYAEDMLRNMVRENNPYSETFRIEPDGSFGRVNRVDNTPRYLQYGNTPEELYRLAQEIQDKHPEYKFDFEKDPGGKWLKYTVSRIKVE